MEAIVAIIIAVAVILLIAIGVVVARRRRDAHAEEARYRAAETRTWPKWAASTRT
jgi:hypothetical protein